MKQHLVKPEIDPEDYDFSTLEVLIIGNTRLFDQTIFSITILERNLRILANLGVSKVYLPNSIKENINHFLRRDFFKLFRIEIDFMENFLFSTGNLVGVLSGDFVYDPRLIRNVFSKESAVILVNEENAICAKVSNIKKFKNIDDYNELLNRLNIRHIAFQSINFYNRKLRKIVKPYIIKITIKNEARAAENIIFDSVYKGATDFITKHVFPKPVKFLVKLISPTGITPNMITYFSIILSFGAIPFYYLGYFSIAIIMSYSMALLDSLDGKLARIKFQESEGGKYLDHVSDYVYLPIWWAVTGYYISNSEFFNDIGILNIVFVLCYLLDKLIAFIFRRRNKISISDFKPIDRFVRLFAFRRNSSVTAFLVGIIFFNQTIAFKIVFYLMSGTTAFHLYRLIVSFLVKKDSDRL